ncbi:MAG: 50S ribosomal protein L18 [Candidatus Bathyarchaeota archaeon]|nr:50S ribosomal protein L18 [Candidatus Bathyarchaeota archaeon]MCX8176893.1 50S ribosomal protein L18 [Candidatus Bathyarchaeota archaeon]MDW8193422.1 50S ribosomal protein L18 [Nitrososphaerota archaeon]
MAKGPSYCVPYRRRREGKTHYRKRKALIISGKPRLVIRGSIKNIVAQVVTAKPEGDVVLVSAHSRELLKNFGWKAPTGNTPAAYLTGLICGLRAKAKGIEEAILDIGLHSPSKGSRIFAVLKGFIDAGVEVSHSEEKLPDDSRINGEHIANYAKMLLSNPEKYSSTFSKYLQSKLPPEELPRHFSEVKQAVIATFKKGGNNGGD